MKPKPSTKHLRRMSERFKCVRERHCITQEELGLMIGLCCRMVRYIESRRYLPRRSVWLRFVAIEKLKSIEDLLTAGEMKRKVVARKQQDAKTHKWKNRVRQKTPNIPGEKEQ